MDFALTEEQEQFAEAIRRFLMTEMTPELTRELWSTETGRSDALWRQLAGQGLTALLVPQEQGGLGLGEVEWAPLAQACGYFALPEPLLDTALVAAGMLRDALAAAPDAAAHERCATLLERIATGDARVAVAHPQERLVADAHVADAILCAHEGAVHLLCRDQAALTARAGLDPSRRLFELAWAPQADSELIPAGTGLWDMALNRGALGVAAQQLGLTQRMLDLAIDYSAQRKQFGKAIGAYQAVKHLLADVAIQLEFAKPVLLRAAAALAHGLPHAGLHVSHARVAAARCAWTAARQAIQVHGAMGYTWELDLQIFTKRAWALAGSWGDRAFHKARLGAHILDGEHDLGAGATFA
ncbi:acyl-CoA dehydrogenase family protein [Cupriavidus sp. AcVe19-1a]|uniref:acyl-CoA dehydrogenase family protein n=1 Tax=Cupriavidus sp. AcVe19-1a TaxID=2821359 RepID=UPI001AEA60EB|nr:acyl-CoA dehydrogenase family protein [Cupriavidus sp. AcVe19-1a]MBP0631073.1 acyl-CoA/acyl-ACP dehydrogenase [Cupriavidus sp. AcVe19-1a]